MSPERILAIAERVEARIMLEYRNTTDAERLAYMNGQLDRTCVLRCCGWLKQRGMALPSMRKAQGD